VFLIALPYLGIDVLKTLQLATTAHSKKMNGFFSLPEFPLDACDDAGAWCAELLQLAT
jgi:hypothetical protein